MTEKNSSGTRVAIIVAIIGVVGSLIVALINKWDFSPNSPVSSQTGLPPAPPDIEETDDYHPIIENSVLLKRISDGELGCQLESGFRIVTVIKEFEEGYEMQDANGQRDTYYLDVEELSNAEASWVDVIMMPGRRLKIQCALCGSGGILELASVEPLKSFK